MPQLRPDTAKNKYFFLKKTYYKATVIQTEQYQNKDRNRLIKNKGVFRNKPIYIIYICTSLMAQMVKNLLAMWETQLQSLGREDPLKMEMATHSNILDREFHGQRSLAGCRQWDHKELDTTERPTVSWEKVCLGLCLRLYI